MKENSNKTIAINSLFLYTKLGLVTICELLTTRFALQALGIYDFGLFSVLGSIISFIAVFNTIMISTSNRFISVAIGKGILSDINEQFNINLIIHILIAVFTLIVLIPIGDLYIYNYLQYSGPISNAFWVFHIAVLGSIAAFIGVPYNGLLVAKEKFFVYSLSHIFSHFFKLIIAFLLLSFFEHKLLIFAVTQGLVSAMPTFVYFIYCKYNYPDIVKFRISKNTSKYKEVFSFSGWVAYGAFAVIAKNQGAAILINMFFNTAMNAALGLANMVSGLLNNFANSIEQPISPQITKSYVQGNQLRTEELLIMSTKFTYLVMLFISTPFLIEPDWLFSLWLKDVPDYLYEFTILIIVDALIISLNSGISNLIFASGKIRLYQVCINTLRLFSIVFAYFVLKLGFPPQSLLWSYILFSIVVFFVSQWVLKKTVSFDNSKLWKLSYFPSLLVTLLIVPFFFITLTQVPLVNILLFEIYLCITVLLFGLSHSEKNQLFSFINQKLSSYSRK